MIYISLTGLFITVFVIGIMLFASRLADKQEQKKMADQRREHGPKD